MHYKIEDDFKLRFLRSGYVGGENTLFAKIFTLNPSQCVQIDKKTGEVEKKRYFNLNYTFAENTKPMKTLLLELDAVLMQVFQDLVRRIEKKAVIVPLSGGCDSRIVVTLLKRLGIENITCVSYGRKSSSEVQISRQIAECLGYQWLYSEYDGRKWNCLFHSEEYKKFLKYSTKGGYGIGCVQALLAFLDIKRHGLLPEDAVVIPGHALDFVAGSHLPYMDSEDEMNPSKLRDFIVTSHYGLNTKISVNLNQAISLSNEITNREDFMSEYLKWEYNNRQSKFIANDVRVYEYLGYSYELPFWDKRLCKFFMKLPFEQLYGRKLQYQYMAEVIDPYIRYKQSYPIFTQKVCELPGMLGRDKIMKWIKPIRKPLKTVKKFYYKMKEHQANEDAFFDWLSTVEFLKLFIEFGMDFSLNSIVVRDYINGRLWENEET